MEDIGSLLHIKKLQCRVAGAFQISAAAAGKDIAQFISFTNGEWIVLTSDGCYNSSPREASAFHN